MKQVINSMKNIPMQNILKATAGFFIGYAGSKILSEKAGSMYSDKKEIVEFGSSVVITGGLGYGYTKINNPHVKSVMAGSLTGAGANTVIKLLKIPQVNQMIPDSFRSTVNLFGDEEEINTLSGNYAELFDYAKNLESQLNNIKQNQTYIPDNTVSGDLGTAIEEYIPAELEETVSGEEEEIEVGKDYDPYSELSGDIDPYALLGDE